MTLAPYLAPYVAILGRGPGRSRSLTQDEAAQAMGIMLRGEAAPEAIGALLMLLRMKGETPGEIAGFAGAAQAALPAWPRIDLDWPSYAAGRTRGLPWFLLSARLVAMAGHSVLIHGRNGSDAALRDHLNAAGVPVLSAPQAIPGIAYIGLEDLSPDLSRLLSLRSVLGLRSCINTVARMLNPARAAASVQGVFHPSYRDLQQAAAALMGWQAMSVIKGAGGEFERHPGKDTHVFGLRAGAAFDRLIQGAETGHVRLAEGPSPRATLAGLWSGQTPDDFAEALVIGTAALALDTLGADTPETLAASLWSERDTARKDAA